MASALGLDVIGYLVKTKNMGITFGGSLRIPLGLKTPPPHFAQSCGLYVYHDSSFGSRPRPMGGYVIMYCNGPVDWHAGFLKIVPDSTHGAAARLRTTTMAPTVLRPAWSCTRLGASAKLTGWRAAALHMLSPRKWSTSLSARH